MIRLYPRLMLTLFALLALGGCASNVHIPMDPAARVVPGALEALSYFDYPRRAVPLSNHTLDENASRYYTIRSLSYPSSGDNGQDGNLVSANFYKSKRPGAKPLVIVLPLWGSYTYPPEKIAKGIRDRAHGEVHVLYMLGERFMLDWPGLREAPDPEAFRRRMQGMVERIRIHVTDVRRFIDWAETDSAIDTSRIAIIGFSHGALISSLITVVDPRIKVSVSVMGGAHPYEIIAGCPLERTNGVRQSVEQRFGWSLERYQSELERLMAPLDVARYPGRVDPAHALIIESRYDECVPKRARDALWESLGRPERYSFNYSHKKAFLSMTPLGLNYMRGIIYDFLDNTL